MVRVVEQGEIANEIVEQLQVVNIRSQTSEVPLSQKLDVSHTIQTCEGRDEPDALQGKRKSRKSTSKRKHKKRKVIEEECDESVIGQCCRLIEEWAIWESKRGSVARRTISQYKSRVRNVLPFHFGYDVNEWLRNEKQLIAKIDNDHRFNPHLIRTFTIAELERLQGLEGWVDSTTIPWTAKVRVLGNALNGDVSIYLAKELKRKMASRVRK